MPPRVDFYVSGDAGEGTRLRLACRVTEKAYLAKQNVVCYSDDPALLPRFDELLWTFGDGSFVPHDTLTRDGDASAAPVVLTTGPLPGGDFIDAQATVLLFVNQKVVANFAFRPGEITEAKIGEVAKALELLKAK